MVCKRGLRWAARAIAACVVLSAFAMAASAGVVDSVFRADKPFPEYYPGWSEGWGAKDAGGQRMGYVADKLPLGGYIHVYFRNDGPKPASLKDVLLNGVSLTKALVSSPQTRLEYHPASIHWSKLPKAKIDRVVAAGEPVWWKIEPLTVEPGKMGEVTIRLRRAPKIKTIPVTLVGEGKPMVARAQVGRRQPEFTDISFSDELDKAYLFVRHAGSIGGAPERVLLDGKDVTSDCDIEFDDRVDVSPIVVKLDTPLTPGTYHSFQAVYADGPPATTGIRAYGHEFVYGMWGSNGDPKVYMPDWARHNINTHMGMFSGYGDYLASKEAVTFLSSLGMRQMASWYGNARKPLYYFLQDEPDAQDYDVLDLDLFDRLGTLGQPLIEKSNVLRGKSPEVVQLLNLDNTFKPANWYTYAQLADIPCADPYYANRVGNTSMFTPEQIAFHLKPTCVYASAAVLQSARSPKPMHIILLSTADLLSAEEEAFRTRFPTPEEKRMEAYYALGAGAKGLSYWWFTPGGGAGSSNPEAKALYKEIGLLGAEIRSAGDAILHSTPVALPVKADPKLWVRTLASGLDTVVVIVVNNDVVCDRAGTAVLPVEKTAVTVTLPTWITAKSVFEVATDGMKDVKWSAKYPTASLELERLLVGRMFIVTRDAKLRERMQKLYDEKFAANVVAIRGTIAE